MQFPSSQRPRLKTFRNLLILAGMATGLVALFPFLVLATILFLQDGWGEWQRCQGYTQFDAQIWQDPDLALSDRYLRSCMVDDLLASNQLTGLSQAEVVTLLGDPSPQNGFNDYDLVYLLGPEQGFISIDFEWLVIKLDTTGHVSKAQIMTD